MKRVALAALLIAATPVFLASAVARKEAETAKTIPLHIRSGEQNRTFRVEVATTPEAQERGLMFRRSMAADHGMIFPMNPPRPASFWMKNTYIPLDIVFIGPDHRIIRIAENATPLSLDLIDCPDPAAAVLELNGGTAKARGIAVGDAVRW